MKPAFTVVELLLYMGIMAVLLVILTNIFLSILDTQTQTETTSAVQIDGRFILSRLSYDIHRASSITTPATVGQTTNVLALDVGTYSVVDGSLLFAGQYLNSYSTQITNFSVSRLGNPGGRHSLQVIFTVTDGDQTQNYQVTVSLR